MTFLKKSFKLDYEKIVSEAKGLKNLDPSIKRRLEEILLTDRGAGAVPLSPHPCGISLISEVKTIEAALKAAPEKIEYEEAKNLETSEKNEICLKPDNSTHNLEKAIEVPLPEPQEPKAPQGLEELSASKKAQEIDHKDNIKKEDMNFPDHTKKRWWTPEEVAIYKFLIGEFLFLLPLGHQIERACARAWSKILLKTLLFLRKIRKFTSGKKLEKNRIFLQGTYRCAVSSPMAKGTKP